MALGDLQALGWGWPFVHLQLLEREWSPPLFTLRPTNQKEGDSPGRPFLPEALSYSSIITTF